MLFSSFWKRGPGPPLWGPGGVLGPLDPPPWIRPRNPLNYLTGQPQHCDNLGRNYLTSPTYTKKTILRITWNVSTLFIFSHLVTSSISPLVSLRHSWATVLAGCALHATEDLGVCIPVSTGGRHRPIAII